MRRFFGITTALLLVACRGEGEPQPIASDPPEVPQPPAPEKPSAVPAGGARQVEEQTDTFIFEFAYPQAAGIEGELAIWLDRQLDERRNALALQAAEGQEAARDSGFPFNKYSSTTEWRVLADLPQWLSMAADLSTYTGGAHPNYGFDSMVWNKQEQVAMEPIAFFVSPAALDKALGEELCRRLNQEREKRRGQPVEEGSGDLFDACVEVNETNLLLESSTDQKFDRIGVKIAPYLAGPYAEGSYEFTFDMSAQLLESVRPEYREFFAARN